MAERTITDDSGRTWLCAAQPGAPGEQAAREGIDVRLSCTTSSVDEPVLITVGWNWEQMSENGLARMVSQAAATKH